MASVTMCFSVDAEADKDIVAFYNRLPRGEKSREFARIHRLLFGRAGVTPADLVPKLDRIIALLESGQVAGPAAPVEILAPARSDIDLSKLDDLGT